MDDGSDSNFLRHIPCDNCGSSDANSLYDDGHSYCFACETHTPAMSGSIDIVAVVNNQSKGLLDGRYASLKKRGLTEETCRKFNYMLVDDYKGKPVQVACYRDNNNQVVAQKLRDSSKNFTILGDAKAMTLYGSHLFSTGKKLVITEGELDAMSVSQAQGHKWATVSLPNGCQAGKKSLMKAWDYLESFEEVILMFDNDEAGIESAKLCAESLPVGKAKIASIAPYKDANEALLKGDTKAIINSIWQAKTYRPDGITSSAELRSVVGKSDVASSVSYPYQRLNEITRGIRTSELISICAGSGVGKSTFLKELIYHLHINGNTCGAIMLEESTKRTIQGLTGIELNKNICIDPEVATEKEIKKAFDKLFKKHPIYLFDHFGSTQVDTILNRIEYMAKGFGCKYLVIDHLSILVSGLTGSLKGNISERQLIDSAMTSLRTLVQNLDICLFVVSHLKRPSNGGSHENGSKAKLSELRGSHSIAQLSDFCLSLNVDKDNPSDYRSLEVLKNRFTGEVGYAGTLAYNRETGRLLDADADSKF